MFLVSMADIIGSYERLPNDAVRAVAVAKRREYLQHTETDKNEQNRKKKKKDFDGFCISLRLAGHSLPLPRLAQLVPTKQLQA